MFTNDTALHIKVSKQLTDKFSKVHEHIAERNKNLQMNATFYQLKV